MLKASEKISGIKLRTEINIEKPNAVSTGDIEEQNLCGALIKGEHEVFSSCSFSIDSPSMVKQGKNK